MSVLRFWRDLTFQYPCSRSGGDLSERGTITEFSNSLTPLDNPQKMVYNGTDRCCVARNAQNTDKLLEGG
jgi:hypothetical protein